MEWKYVSPQWPESVTFMTVEEMIDKFDLTENQINHLKQVAQNYNQNNMTTKQYITQLLAEIKEKGCTISEEVLSGSLDTLVTLAKGEQRLEENRVYMDSLNNSKEIIGHHITEANEIQPSEMIKGHWYFISNSQNEYIFKFDYLETTNIIYYQIMKNTDKTCGVVKCDWFRYDEGDKIIPASISDVNKYFPNEFQ
jgi:hypothetical protein